MEERRTGPSNQQILDAVHGVKGDLGKLNIRLFGTEDGTEGTGGRLSSVEGDIHELDRKVQGHDTRIGKLENWRWYLLGVAGAIGAIAYLVIDIASAAGKH